MGMKFVVNDKDISDLLEHIELRANALVIIVKELKDTGTIYDVDTERIRSQVLSLIKDSKSLNVLCALKGIINGD